MGVLKKRSSRALACACAFSLAVSAHGRAQQSAGTRENDVKAAFLYNFAKYIVWPETAFGAPTDPFRICVVGDKAFSNSVARTVEGEIVDGRRFEPLEPPSEEEARTCHLLFIGRSEMTRAERLLAATAAVPVLTVSDSTELLDRGETIALMLDDNRMRFDVNIAAARSHGLTVSSKLLRVARKVVERPPSGR
jgi:hypothetical protein